MTGTPGDVRETLVADTCAERVGQQRTSRHNYAPLIHLLALTGMRVSEALALRWEDVDLLAGEVRVRHSLSRVGGGLTTPKTTAGTRMVPIGPGLVDRLVKLKPLEATDEHFVFSTRPGGRPIQYWNFRDRGFVPALKAAGLDGKGITIHDLRSAAISLYAASGLSLVEVAAIVGHSDAMVTARHYARLFDRSDVATRARAAQSSIST